MASRRRNERLSNYVLMGSAGLFLVAVAALAFAFLRGRTTPIDRTSEISPVPPRAADFTRRAEGKPSGPSPVEAPAKQARASAPVENSIVLRSDDLRQQYANNEVDADQKYKDKLLEVTGAITAVYQESPLIGIGFGQPQDPLPSILCEMDRQQLDLLSKLRRGHSITVRGTGMGKIQGGFIGIGNCRIVSSGR